MTIRLVEQRLDASRRRMEDAAAETQFWTELADLLPALARHHTSRAKDASIGASAQAYHAGFAKRLRAVLGW